MEGNFFVELLNSEMFMPHGQCFLWYPEVLWLHVISDVTIVVAYFSIPVTILYVLRKRRTLPYKWVLAMFSAFIFLCGATHFMGVWVLWDPQYRLEGLLKALTAGASLATAILIIPLVPDFLRVLEEMQRQENSGKSHDESKKL